MRKLLFLLFALCAISVIATYRTPTAQPILLTPETALHPRNLECPLKQLSGSTKHFIGALKESINYFKENSDATFRFGPVAYSSEELIAGYSRLLRQLKKEKITDRTFIDFVCAHFKFFSADTSYVRFTGYFEPVVKGSTKQSSEFPFPVYGVPLDLKENVPYHSRRIIESKGILKNRNLEIAWVADQIDLFFLHIQGTGKIALEDGSELRVGYAANNGHTYKAIGSLLIAEGVIDKSKMSMQAIKSYLRNNPAEIERVLQYNPRYIFFRLLPTSSGPIGSLGKPLTPYHSIATDSSLFPLGALALITVTVPAPQTAARQHSYLALNQDTGAAIKTAARADLFLGSGETSEFAAGHLNSPGSLYFIAPHK